MEFCTAVNCMDGRVQSPVIEYLKQRFDARFVDMITDPGPNRLLAEQQNAPLVKSLLVRIKISVEHHGSQGIAVIGHHDCAGNPAPEDEQAGHTRAAVAFLKEQYPATDVIGLWVDQNWSVNAMEL